MASSMGSFRLFSALHLSCLFVYGAAIYDAVCGALKTVTLLDCEACLELKQRKT